MKEEISQLNDAIRDVLASFDKSGIAASNRQAAEEVILRFPKLVKNYGRQLAFNALVARIRNLRKKPRCLREEKLRPEPLPGMAEHLLPRLPADIPRFPADNDDKEATGEEVEQQEQVDEEMEQQQADEEAEQQQKFDEDEIPWGSIWTSTVAELRRYAAHLLAGIRADTARLKVIRELLDLIMSAGAVDDDMRVIDAIRKAAAVHENVH